MTIFPVKVYLYPQTGVNQPSAAKTVHLVNNSKMPAHYQIHYDWANCPIACHPPSGVVERRVQLGLELKCRRIGYYYKRLYVLITYHVNTYVFIARSVVCGVCNPRALCRPKPNVFLFERSIYGLLGPRNPKSFTDTKRSRRVYYIVPFI